MSEATPFGIYLHIPYCKAKCRYCDFYSAPGARGVPQSYLDALLRELAKNTRRPDTLYFGGGTPALLVPAQAAALIEAANPLPGAEITLEANPDVVTPETLRGFRVTKHSQFPAKSWANPVSFKNLDTFSPISTSSALAAKGMINIPSNKAIFSRYFSTCLIFNCFTVN